MSDYRLFFHSTYTFAMNFCCFKRCASVKERGSLPEKSFLQSTVYKPTTEVIEEKTVLLDEDSAVITQQPVVNGEASPAIDPRGGDIPPPVPSKLSRTPTHPVAVEDLAEYVRNAIQIGELKREHELLPKGQLRSCNRAMESNSKDKNRYGNLLAYDETRVVLNTDGDSEIHSDYINANYVDGHSRPKAYIATQGPKENTIEDFWRMIWQEKVSKVIMLTNVVELGKRKCEKYWPDAVQVYGNIKVTLESSKTFADFIIRHLKIKKEGDNRCHPVTQYHYTSWPDHGVPAYPSVLVSFIKKINEDEPRDNSNPIVVHCSAGINRTGTVILIDSMIHMGQEEGVIDVLGHLYEMRYQRLNILDNSEQYELVHTAVLEALLIESTSIPCSEFQAFYTRATSETNHYNQISQQHKVLESYRPILSEDSTRSGLEQCNLSKNRDLNVLPDEKQRVYLKQTGSFPSNYINAVYVSCYKQKDTFIVTQFPLSETVVDYWRMIVDQQCHLVVVLNDLNLRDKTIVPFYPQQQGETMELQNVHLKSENVFEENGLFINVVHYKCVKGLQQERQVYFVQFKGWHKGVQTPPSSDKLINLLEGSLRLRQSLPAGPMLITCFDGSTASGLFCAAAFICMKIKVEQEVDVFTAVRSIRNNRSTFINNVQYKYCYEMALSFLDSFKTYANFQ